MIQDVNLIYIIYLNILDIPSTKIIYLVKEYKFYSFLYLLVIW